MRTRSKRMRAHARGERDLMIMNIQQVRENERMVQVGAWGSGSGCPTSRMVAADCPPRPIGRVRGPRYRIIAEALAVTIHRRPTDLSRAFPDLSACHAPAIDRARLSAARSRRSRRRSGAARESAPRRASGVLINARRMTPTSYENRNGPWRNW